MGQGEALIGCALRRRVRGGGGEGEKGWVRCSVLKYVTYPPRIRINTY